jgi:hypothetical protein
VLGRGVNSYADYATTSKTIDQPVTDKNTTSQPYLPSKEEIEYTSGTVTPSRVTDREIKLAQIQNRPMTREVVFQGDVPILTDRMVPATEPSSLLEKIAEDIPRALPAIPGLVTTTGLTGISRLTPAAKQVVDTVAVNRTRVLHPPAVDRLPNSPIGIKMMEDALQTPSILRNKAITN